MHRDDEMISLPAVAQDGGSSHAPAFGVYIHWPFCLSKCPYCDFNSHVREQVDQVRWRQAHDPNQGEHRKEPTSITHSFLQRGHPQADSEDSQWIKWRSCSFIDPQRRSREQKLVTIQPPGLLDRSFEIKIVENGNSHRDQCQSM